MNKGFDEFSEETLTALHEWAYHYGLSFEEMAELRGITVEELVQAFQAGILQNSTLDN